MTPKPRAVSTLNKLIVRVSVSDLFRLYCKAANKHGVLLSYKYWHYDTVSLNRLNQLFKACPFLDFTKYEKRDLDSSLSTSIAQLVSDGEGLILCRSAKVRDEVYNWIVGDDGPTSVNKYNGPVRVYALTCDNKGRLLNENT